MNPVDAKRAFFYLLACITVTLAACTPTTQDLQEVDGDPLPQEVGPADFLGGLVDVDETQHFYIATDGFDRDDVTGGNVWRCQNVDRPCLTLAYAMAMAHLTESSRTSGPYFGSYHFHIGPGTHVDTFDRTASSIHGSIRISGAGPDQTFLINDVHTVGQVLVGTGTAIVEDLSILEVQQRGCIYIPETYSAVNESDEVVDLPNSINVTIQNADLLYCHEAGVEHRGTGQVNLTNVNVREGGVDSRYGIGLLNFGDMVVNGGEYTNNWMGVRNYGQLSTEDSAITDNIIGVEARDGSVDLNHVIIADNEDVGIRAYQLDEGANPIVNVADSRISRNQDGVSLINAGQLTMTNSIISDHPGFALSLTRNTSAVVEHSSITDNMGMVPSSGWGDYAILNNGELDVSYSLFARNLGHAIMNILDGTAQISFSEFSNNTSQTDSIIQNSSTTNPMVLANSLVRHNDMIGGYPVVAGWLQVTNTTISNNAGSGLSLGQGSSVAYSTIAENRNIGFSVGDTGVDIHNLLVVGNGISGEGVDGDCYWVATGVSFSGFDSDASCGADATYSIADLGIGALGNYGGPTMTHALAADSPAVDAAEGDCPADDQRTMNRPVGAACDVGAVERGGIVAQTRVGASLPEIEEISGEAPAGELIVVPDQNLNCRYGNSNAFEVADTLLQGQEYLPVGIGPDALWLQFEGPSFGELCWSFSDGFTLFLNGVDIPLNQLPDTILKVVNYPPIPPTATPTPDPDEGDNFTPTPLPSATATCYYNQNNVYICP